MLRRLPLFLLGMLVAAEAHPGFRRRIPFRSACSAVGARIGRTLGVESEVSTLPKTIDPRGGSNVASLIGSSRFQRLFAFYGKSGEGLVRDLIPKEVTETEDFAKLRAKYPEHFHDVAGQVYLRHWGAIGADKVYPVILGLLKARGPGSDSLTLRKIPEAWREKTGKYDRMIPDQVRDDWGITGFMTLEFPMEGHVREAKELREYLRNLWLRLGLFRADQKAEIEDALDRAVGHVHWKPDIASLPVATPAERNAKRRAYDGMIGYWGDANDAGFVAFMQLPAKPKEDGSVEMSAATAFAVMGTHEKWFLQDMIFPLTQSTYGTLEATPEGIRENGAEPAEPGFSLDLKYHFMGLRSVYEAPKPGSNPRVVAAPGLENRAAPTVTEGVMQLPKVLPGTGNVDVPALTLHARGGERGLVDGADALNGRARTLGLDQRLVATVEKVIEDTIEPATDTIWDRKDTRAALLAPLTDWRNQPLVKRKLAAMTDAARERFLARLAAAQERYRARVNALVRARYERDFAYRPDWTDAPKLFEGLGNLVHPESPRGIPPKPMEKMTPDSLFTLVLTSENSRFFTESGLSDVLRVP